ncbi:Ig-like domain-containing protein [Sphingobacterium daejeonense]|uniref:glucoamylase family protein n=1 Tax=Sphingobacterium daejeonense TaxID=371142 RepID=UPI0021A2E418|nr:glucoamylase family protein [Sphingobacterium daejeonense]MCT1531412.1 Ig-like domain-containing protein [Sphingobacterium daejeonense]
MKISFIFIISLLFLGCSKSNDPSPTPNDGFAVNSVAIGNNTLTANPKGIELAPEFIITFDETIADQDLANNIQILNADKSTIPATIKLIDAGKKVTIKPNANLSPLSKYEILVKNTLKSTSNSTLKMQYNFSFNTAIDQSDKFKRISEDELLTLVQKQTFAYFWDFAHPTSGMIRERSTSNETVTIGGTGFGIMAIIVGANRNFISKNEGLERTKKIVAFLKSADKYHGAFSHWYNGGTGKTQPFSEKDNGADLVETSLLFQGLIAAREYYQDPNLSTDINNLFNAVEWSFFQNGQKALYWHWSPSHAWDMNLKIQGWNESLITYVLAAGATNHAIEKSVYDEGWAKNGSIKNGKSFFNYVLPLGPDNGGPLFTAQYSFLGINPTGLKDAYADYELQVKNQTLINRAYCISNPKGYYGYGNNNWGLTAGDIPNGYGAQSPNNDIGVIAPTAALSSMAFTPKESKEALEFFYYKLGDKLWGKYGFKDGFSLHEPWFAESYIAIDQGPIIIAIENHRSQLIWNLLMKSPEIKNGLKKLGFTSPHI